MPRVKRGVTARARHQKVLKLAKGYRGRRKNVYRIAKQAVMKSLKSGSRSTSFSASIRLLAFNVDNATAVRSHRVNGSPSIASPAIPFNR